MVIFSPQPLKKWIFVDYFVKMTPPGRVKMIKFAIFAMDSKRWWSLLSKNRSILNLREFFHSEKYGFFYTTCCGRHNASLGHYRCNILLVCHAWKKILLDWYAVWKLISSHIFGALMCPLYSVNQGITGTRGLFNIKKPSCQYRKFHCEDRTILSPSYLHNRMFYTGKMTFLIESWSQYSGNHFDIL